jgi:hypothetical protein
MSFRGRLARLTSLGGAALLALALAGSLPGAARADAPSPSFSIDAVPGGSIDSTRSVPTGSTFSVAVVLDTYTGGPYQSYQVNLDYDDVELDAAGFPASWTDAPVADTTGGNTAVFPGGPLCDPGTPENTVTSEDDAGSAQIAMTCADAETGGTTTHTGSLVEIVFRCETGGSATLSLGDVNGTFLLDADIESLNDHTHDATITCGGAAVATNTPAAATATPGGATVTPGAATSTPGGGAQPTVIAPSAGTPSSGVVPPDTGSGPDAGAGAGVAFAVAAGASLLAGAALTGFGMARRRARR